jgi:hypothetical protein
VQVHWLTIARSLGTAAGFPAGIVGTLVVQWLTRRWTTRADREASWAAMQQADLRALQDAVHELWDHASRLKALTAGGEDDAADWGALNARHGNVSRLTSRVDDEPTRLAAAELADRIGLDTATDRSFGDFLDNRQHIAALDELIGAKLRALHRHSASS